MPIPVTQILPIEGETNRKNKLIMTDTFLWQQRVFKIGEEDSVVKQYVPIVFFLSLPLCARIELSRIPL